MDDPEQLIRNWSAFVQINLGMACGTLDGIRESLIKMTPAQRTDMARELDPTLDRVERTLAGLRAFLTPRKN
jgi:hypothetical protein